MRDRLFVLRPGFIDAAKGEECDDGNNDDSDDCRNDCTLPPSGTTGGTTGGATAGGDTGGGCSLIQLPAGQHSLRLVSGS